MGGLLNAHPQRARVGLSLPVAVAALLQGLIFYFLVELHWRTDEGFELEHDNPVQELTVQHKYATIWLQELQAMGIRQRDPTQEPEAWLQFQSHLDNLHSANVDILFTSLDWKDIEYSPDEFKWDYLDQMALRVCGMEPVARPLKLIVLLSLWDPPAYILEHYPDAKVQDAWHKGEYTGTSFSHTESVMRAQNALKRCTVRLLETVGDCLHSVSPSYNNEYETKYTQEHDLFQDYSQRSQKDFQAFLQHRHPSLDFWNVRWRHPTYEPFQSWESVRMPPYRFWHGPDVSTLLHDLLAFRRDQIGIAVERSCRTVRLAGSRCLLHFGEFFTQQDAIYQNDVFFQLAKSPWVDYLVVDTNFYTLRDGALPESESLRLARLLSSTAVSYGKYVFFEAALERQADFTFFGRALTAAAESGAHGLAVTNWLKASRGGAVALRDLFPATPVEAGNQVPEYVVLSPSYGHNVFSPINPGGQRDLARMVSKRRRPSKSKPTETVRNVHVYADVVMLWDRLVRGELPLVQGITYMKPLLVSKEDDVILTALELHCFKHGVEFETVKHFFGSTTVMTMI